MIEYFLDTIGFFGPVILLVLSLVKILKQKYYLIGYLVFYFINDAINQLCKITIKQERPHGGKKIMDEPYVGADKYGMPSRHTQSMFFSTTYLFMVNRNKPMLLFELSLCTLTFCQRLKYKQHSIEQLTVGGFIGIITACFAYYFTNRYIISSV